MPPAPKEPPKLLHVFPSFSVGGAQVRFTTVANHFGAAFSHYLMAMDGDYECCERLNSNLRFEILRVPLHKGQILHNLYGFRKTLNRLRPTLLVTHNWGSIEWAMANWFQLTRHIHIEDGFGREEATSQFLRRVWTRRVFLRNSIVVVPSLTLKRIALDIWRLPPSRVLYIPNGIDCERYGELRRTPSQVSSQTPTIGIVSALRPEKNVSRLIRAFAKTQRIVDCHLLIVGDGPERAALEDLIRELGLTDAVTLAGHLDDPTIAYAQIDVFALSSDTEQMPYTIIEAMAAGLPIVATNVGDVSEMVSPRNLPYIVPPNSEQLAQALLHILRDPESRVRIGAANREKARANFDQRRMLERYGKIFRAEPDTLLSV